MYSGIDIETALSEVMELQAEVDRLRKLNKQKISEIQELNSRNGKKTVKVIYTCIMLLLTGIGFAAGFICHAVMT